MCCDVTDSCHYGTAALLAQVRHIIIHNDGKIDDDFLKKVEKLGLTFRESEDSDSIVWDPEASGQVRGCWKGRPFCIAIDEFILPMLREIQTFVGQAEQALIQCLRGRTSKPDPTH